MNPNLVRIIRQRMEPQTTEQLLDLWVINDRATWSPETFEAVRSILTERGKTDLPPPNDPAPVAARWTHRAQPEAVYWMGWLRPVLWLAVVVSFLTLLRAPLTFWQFAQSLYAPRTTPWTPTELAVPMLTSALLPGWMLAGAAGALRFKKWGRQALLLYPLAAGAVQLWLVFQSLQGVTFRQVGNWYGPVLAAGLVESFVRSMALPLVLYFLMRRPEIRSIYVVETGRGFDPAARQPAPLADPTLP